MYGTRLQSPLKRGRPRPSKKALFSVQVQRPAALIPQPKRVWLLRPPRPWAYLRGEQLGVA
jgi:hypothetical protein